MASQEPIDRLVQALENPDELRSLDKLRRRLGPAGQRLSLSCSDSCMLVTRLVRKLTYSEKSS